MKTGRDREREKEGRQKETIESKLARAPAPRVFPREPTSLSQACECHNRSQITDHRKREREKGRKRQRWKEKEREKERKRETQITESEKERGKEKGEERKSEREKERR